jgi:DNA-binding transcriptional LysR family regulator
VDDWTAPAAELPGLRDRKYDLTMVRLVGPIPSGDPADELHFETLLNDQLVVAVGWGHRLARRRKVDLSELSDERWILAQPGTWNYSRLAEAFRAQGLAMPQASFVSVSVAVRTRLLATGKFVTALPSTMLSLNRDHYALKALPIELPNPPWPVVMVTLKNRTLSPIVERFMACAREVAQSL